MKSSKVFAIFLVGCFMGFFPFLADTEFKGSIFGLSKKDQKLDDFGNAGTATSPISINGDSEMDIFSPKTGSGTESDPYIIKDLDFSALSGTGYQLQIANVDERHVVIRNCDFSFPPGYSGNIWGVILSNCKNITVENCSFHCPVSSGLNLQIVYISGCEQISVINNTFSDIKKTNTNILYCIYAGGGSGNHEFIGNHFTDISSEGNIYCFTYSDASSIFSNNHVYDIETPDDFYFLYASNDNSDEIIVKENTIFDVIAGTDGTGNFLGFSCMEPDYSTFRDNIIGGCEGAVVTKCLSFLASSTNNKISGNAFMAGDSPVSDFGTNNQWYELRYYAVTGGFQYFGNHYWNNTDNVDSDGNYIADNPYAIYVTQDNYPLLVGAVDIDQDGLLGYEELELKTDLLDIDTDDDGWTDYEEARVYGTSPLAQDTDGDGINDPQDPTPNDANPDMETDSDGDQLTDYEETTVFHTSPNIQDTDGDGWSDYDEIKRYGTDPLSQDTDGDGISDPEDPKPIDAGPDTTTDTDGDGLADYYENTEFFTDPLVNDTDGDGWSDYDEIKKYGTDPLSQDTDGDGIIDSQDALPKSAPALETPDYTTSIMVVGISIGAGLLVLGAAIASSASKKTKLALANSIPEGNLKPQTEKADKIKSGSSRESPKSR